jgi:hypothetical protein
MKTIIIVKKNNTHRRNTYAKEGWKKRERRGAWGEADISEWRRTNVLPFYKEKNKIDIDGSHRTAAAVFDAEEA